MRLSDEPFKERRSVRKPAVIDPHVRKRAAGWLITLENADSSQLQAHWPKFMTWLDAFPAHRETYLWVEHCWHEAASLVRAMPRELVEELIAEGDFGAKL